MTAYCWYCRQKWLAMRQLILKQCCSYTEISRSPNLESHIDNFRQDNQRLFYLVTFRIWVRFLSFCTRWLWKSREQLLLPRICSWVLIVQSIITQLQEFNFLWKDKLRSKRVKIEMRLTATIECFDNSLSALRAILCFWGRSNLPTRWTKTCM